MQTPQPHTIQRPSPDGSYESAPRSTPSLDRPVISRSEEKSAMEFLRENHPDFFADEYSQKIGAIIISEMSHELSKHSPVERAGMVACIMSLMYRMSTAAMKSIRDDNGRDMNEIFTQENWPNPHI